MTNTQPLRVAALVDLPRSRTSGGHIKGWEKLARAAARSGLPLDLTLICSGPELVEELSPHVRIKQFEPVFSTSRLKFLPYVPDNTDLASFHPKLAAELEKMEVIHTTDGFFCYAQTAEKISKQFKRVLTTSFHTDTPAYARVFTRLTIDKLCGPIGLAPFLNDTLKIPEWQEKKKIKRLKAHLACCRKAFFTRREDRDLAESIIGPENVTPMRLGVDREQIGPHRADRSGVERDYKIPQGRVVFIFVGRLDVGKNIYTLIEAMERLIADGESVHLITAGLGPAETDLRERLAGHVSIAGYVDPDELGRLYASVDALALCSEVEIRSMASVEAIASGLPVLVSEKSGIARLFDMTPAMRVVPAGVDAWEMALREHALSVNERAHRRKVALAYADMHIMDWNTVLAEDLFAHWWQAAGV